MFLEKREPSPAGSISLSARNDAHKLHASPPALSFVAAASGASGGAAWSFAKMRQSKYLPALPPRDDPLRSTSYEAGDPLSSTTYDTNPHSPTNTEGDHLLIEWQQITYFCLEKISWGKEIEGKTERDEEMELQETAKQDARDWNNSLKRLVHVANPLL